MSGLVKICPDCNGSGKNKYGGTTVAGVDDLVLLRVPIRDPSCASSVTHSAANDRPNR